jgi:type II secretory ATPase GspE/PulE/Tfp pilus assembly ATPase PilB-like protein
VRFYVQTPIVPVMATREEIEQAIRVYYGADPRAREGQLARAPRAEVRRVDVGAGAAEDADTSASRLVGRMIAEAYAAGASDIHIDASAGPQHVAVRFRREGELVDYVRLPAHLRSSIITRIKAIAGIDISERRRAQEGRIEVVEDGPADLQLRVVTVPTRDGNEDVAIRLMPARESLPLQMLGLSDAALGTIKELLARPYGLLLISGPPGSGKTTTAYGLLSLLEAPGAKIWTAESPVEAARPASSQVEVNEKTGWDYPAVIRTIMRADPDVMLIGDLRDRESAALAVETSLRGTVSLAVLHGNSAPETLARLLDMGVDAFSLADSLLGVVTQRLAKRLCLRCRISRTLTAAEIDMLLEEYCAGAGIEATDIRAGWLQRFGPEPLIYGAEGCDLCARTGYRGRIGLYEVLRSGAAMRTLLSQRKPLAQLAAAAMQNGMRTLKQDAIEKALAGHCDIREVRAATV